MKTCAYCGFENEHAAASCARCGTNGFNEPPRPLLGSQSPSIWPWSKRTRRNHILAQSWPEQWESWLRRNFTHYPLLTPEERFCLQNFIRIFIAEKIWEGCAGLHVTDLMKVTIAAQAGLMLLHLEHDFFSRVYSVVLFPSDFELPPDWWQEHKGTIIRGQAVDYGSVFLAWDAVLRDARSPSCGHNLVIHEFAHQLDFLDGYTNGTPELRGREQTRRWQLVMNHDFNLLRRNLRKSRTTFLGSYAATNPAEFFSVLSEKFFLLPARLRHYHPELFEILREFYGIDPSKWLNALSAEPKPRIPTAHPETNLVS